jgi:hypothetical protein
MASVTWATLKAQIARKLDDTSYRTYSEGLLLDAVNDALEAFAAAHTGVASDIELTGDGTTYEFDLPSDLIEEEGAGVYAVHWTQNTWLTELEYWPGKAWPNSTRSTSSNPLGYILWPQGKISFSRIPKASQAVTIHYVAYYAEVVNDDSTISVPRWARSAIKHFVCAEALEPGSAKASKLGQYKSKRESGDPEDNPLLRLAEHYMKRYYEVLAAHQPPQYTKLQPHEGRYYK